MRGGATRLWGICLVNHKGVTMSLHARKLARCDRDRNGDGLISHTQTYPFAIAIAKRYSDSVCRRTIPIAIAIATGIVLALIPET